ncbi:MAG: ClpXP protease specificity-enhancing factor, partial [Gammaproteobacteria bacterium]|nr:ClpXP protease specificity-enhancing factor [Gammaproteobacteria bacterium]
MKSRRPYLIRAMHEWMLDTNQIPHILVNAEMKGVEVPRQYVRDGKIVLNLNPTAVNNLVIDNEYIEFDARFGGSPHRVCVPVVAVLAIYARESGQGMMFSEEDSDSAD